MKHKKDKIISVPVNTNDARYTQDSRFVSTFRCRLFSGDMDLLRSGVIEWKRCAFVRVLLFIRHEMPVLVAFLVKGRHDNFMTRPSGLFLQLQFDNLPCVTETWVPCTDTNPDSLAPDAETVHAVGFARHCHSDKYLLQCSSCLSVIKLFFLTIWL